MTRFQDAGAEGARLPGPASAARRSGTRPSCARRCRCPTCSAPPGPDRPRCGACSTPCRPTSRRESSPQDRKTANLAFGIRLMPLDRQKDVVDDIKARLEAAAGRRGVRGRACRCWPPRRTARCPRRGGARSRCSPRWPASSSCCSRRAARSREAAVPLIPIALATGWSGSVVFVLGLLPGPLEVDLNPMSVTLSALVIAISTEFSVLLSARYRQERDARRRPGPGDRAGVRVHRRGGARLGRRPRSPASRALVVLRHPDAARLRHRDRGRPDRVAARGDDRAAGGAPVGRGARARSACATCSGARQAASRPAGRRRDRARERGPLRGPVDRASGSPSATARTRSRARRPEVPRAGNKYAWAVGIAGLMGLGVLLFAETLPNQGKGLRGPEVGQPLPAFAAPSAAGDARGRRQRLPEEALQQERRATCRPATCAGTGS